MPKDRDPSDAAADGTLEQELDAAAKDAPIARVKGAPSEHRIADLLAYNTQADPNCLLGERAQGVTSRWLCKGGSVVWTGVSGAGKSSMLMQAACSWAVGLDFFGIATPNGALRSLVVQAENDAGDLSEALKGVINHVPGLKENVARISENVKILSGAQGRGDKFREWITPDILEFKPQLLWIDPLLAYAVDVLDQAEISKFLRDVLDPLAKENELGLMVFHHTGKPPKDKASAHAGWTPSDYAYMGLGSSEITNWARAVMYIHRREERKYKLIGAKRGSRANLGGNNQDSIDIKWGKHGIYWELDEEDASKSNESEYDIAEAAIKTMISDGARWKKTQLEDAMARKHGRQFARNAWFAFEKRWLNDWHPTVAGEPKMCNNLQVVKEKNSFIITLTKP